MNINEAIWIEGQPDENRFAKAGDTLTCDCYLQDANLGQLTRVHGIGWSKWKWKSFSHLGDLLHVDDNNDLRTIKQELRDEIVRVCG